MRAHFAACAFVCAWVCVAASTNSNRSIRKVKRTFTTVASAGESKLKAFLVGLASGAVAGTTVDLVLFPLDTIKTRLQAKSGVKLSLSLVKGMYNGIVPAVCASAPACAAFFGAYDVLKRTIAPKFGPGYGPVVNMLAACGGDLAQSVVRVPFEVVKQRMQAGIDSTAAGAVKNILAKQGVRGFFTGWSALALRDLPFDAIEFPLYEFLKSELRRRRGRELHTWENSLCGSVAGGIAAGITTPLDVVKTRVMTTTGVYANMGDCFMTLLTKEGPRSLFAGVGPRVMLISFGGAIFFGAYEAAKSVILARNLLGTNDP